jgi:hypothetical protein
MAEAIKRDRRRFLGDAVMTLAAVELGVKGGVGTICLRKPRRPLPKPSSMSVASHGKKRSPSQCLMHAPRSQHPPIAKSRT